MVTAIVEMNVDRLKINELAQAVAGIDGVSEVYSVGGRFDLVANVRVRNAEELAEVVTTRLARLPGIVSTETMIAFRAYSRHDLEALFSIGIETE